MGERDTARPDAPGSLGRQAPLPRYDASRQLIVYHEYDVNPHRPEVDRRPQRLVVGDGGSAWATGDHYVTWVRLR